MKKILILFVLISLIGVQYVFAHPFTIKTDPAQLSNMPAGTSQVIVYYSEGVEINFSVIKVFDSNGDQIDNKDAKYYEGDYSLIVTTPPLEDGVYTVTSKVLSKVDGHLVDSAFIFGVGDIKVEEAQPSQQSSSDVVFLPEAGSRFPGIVGQTIVLGAVISSLMIWGTQRKDLLKKELEKFQKEYHSKFMSITGIGMIIVFASNILMLTVQTLRLETSAFDALQTNFGNTWIVRMILTVILLGIWFWLERKKIISIKKQIPLLVFSLALIGTTTMMGHGAASEEMQAIILDYVHNLVAAIWVGGIIFFVFILLPSFSVLNNEAKEKLTLVSIPRFSIAFVIAVGIIIISGPTLLWSLESDVGLITESTYGKLILTKIAIAAVMVGIGGYFQLGIQKKAENDLKSGTIAVYKKLKRSLKIDAGLGIILLGVVALLTNGSLPAGEVQKVEAQETIYGFSTIAFSENVKFDVEIFPLITGSNDIRVTVTDLDGKTPQDLSDLKVKVSNPIRGIAPIQIPMNTVTDGENQKMFEGDASFGFSGSWQVEIEAKRTENANEVVILDLLIKPRLTDLKNKVIEYELPEDAAPLYPVFDGRDSIWISDPSAPRIWKFSLETKEFEKFDFQGQTSITLAIDNQGRIWFTDIPGGQIGSLDPNTNKIDLIKLPSIKPSGQNSIAISLLADFEDNIWITITNKDVLLKYDQNSKTFEEIRVPTKEAGPFALALDLSGNVWFSETIAGKIGMLDPKTNSIKEFSPNKPLQAPESLIFDEDGNLWIAEHTGLALTKFNPVLNSFERVKVPDKDALPFGMVFDRYGNIWFAQHTVDKLGVYDPDNDSLIEVPIATTNSFAQFATTDDEGNIWFVEQQGNKIGKVESTEVPLAVPPKSQESTKVRYSEIVSPLMALGIIATSLFFVKNVRDKRRINSLVHP